MFKKYMLKLTNTMGTVQYLQKVSKDNDSNNNENSCSSNSSDKRKPKKYRNSMTAEMMLDIGPLVPIATTQSAEQSPTTPQTTPSHQLRAPSFPTAIPEHNRRASAAAAFCEDRPPPLRRRSSRFPAPSSEDAIGCDASYEDLPLRPPLPPLLRRASRLPATEELYDSVAASSQTSSDQETDDRGGEDADTDTMAVLSAAILQLRNTLLYYSLVFE